MFLPVESDIDVDFIDPEHGVLLQAFVDAVTGRAEPDRVDLGIDVTHFEGLFKIGKPEAKVLES